MDVYTGMQCMAACCSVLLVCCSVWKCVAVCYTCKCTLGVGRCITDMQCVAVCCSVLQCVAVYCIVMQCVNFSVAPCLALMFARSPYRFIFCIRMSDLDNCTLQHTATHCNTATHFSSRSLSRSLVRSLSVSISLSLSCFFPVFSLSLSFLHV